MLWRQKWGWRGRSESITEVTHLVASKVDWFKMTLSLSSSGTSALARLAICMYTHTHRGTYVSHRDGRSDMSISDSHDSGSTSWISKKREGGVPWRKGVRLWRHSAHPSVRVKHKIRFTDEGATASRLHVLGDDWEFSVCIYWKSFTSLTSKDTHFIQKRLYTENRPPVLLTLKL